MINLDRRGNWGSLAKKRRSIFQTEVERRIGIRSLASGAAFHSIDSVPMGAERL